MSDKLDAKILQFMTLSLPGQPVMMHMGTSNLIQELNNHRREALAALSEAKEKLALYRANHPGAAVAALAPKSNGRHVMMFMKRFTDPNDREADDYLDTMGRIVYFFMIVGFVALLERVMP